MQVNLIGLDKIWTRESIDKGRSTKTTRRREGQTTQATSSKETVPGGGGGGTVTSSKANVPAGGGGTGEGWCGCHARAAGGGRGMQRVHSRQPPACAVAPSKTSISLLEDLEKLSAADCTLTYKKKTKFVCILLTSFRHYSPSSPPFSTLLSTTTTFLSLYIYIAFISLWK